MTQPVSNVRVRRTQKLLRKGLPVDVFQSSQDFPHLLAGVPHDATEGIEPIHLTTLLTRSDLSTTATTRGCRLLHRSNLHVADALAGPLDETVGIRQVGAVGQLEVHMLLVADDREQQPADLHRVAERDQLVAEVDLLDATKLRDVAGEQTAALPTADIIRSIATDHSRTVKLLRELDATALRRTARLPTGEEVTAEFLVRYPLINHLEQHVEQLEQALR